MRANGYPGRLYARQLWQHVMLDNMVTSRVQRNAGHVVSRTRQACAEQHDDGRSVGIMYTEIHTIECRRHRYTAGCERVRWSRRRPLVRERQS